MKQVETGEINKKSSKKVSEFLEKNNLHKKDFAQMIGVTLSYVYNLIDESIPFSTRSTTLERIATVMDIMPEDFEEYVIEQDPVPYNRNLEKIKDYIKENKMTVTDFLKQFERKKRLKIVDTLRGVEPLSVDYFELKQIKDMLNIPDEEFFELWRNIFTDYLEKGGFDVVKNKEMQKKIRQTVKEYIFCKKDICNIS